MKKQMDKMSTRAKSKVENIRTFFIIKFVEVTLGNNINFLYYIVIEL